MLHKLDITIRADITRRAGGAGQPIDPEAEGSHHNSEPGKDKQ